MESFVSLNLTNNIIIKRAQPSYNNKNLLFVILPYFSFSSFFLKTNKSMHNKINNKKSEATKI